MKRPLELKDASKGLGKLKRIHFAVTGSSECRSATLYVPRPTENVSLVSSETSNERVSNNHMLSRLTSRG